MEAPDSRKLLQQFSFVIIDLETTGGDHQDDQIIEIGLVKIDQLEITSELHFLIDPERPIPPFVQRLISITPKDLVNAPKIIDVIDRVVEFIGNSIVVAHNISFDFPFLNSVLQRLQRPPLDNPALCTHLMSQHLIPNILSSNLSYMGQLFDIPHAKAHRALEDARACALLLLNFLEIFIEKGIYKINQLYYPQNKFKLNQRNFTLAQRDQFLSTIQKLKTSAIISFKQKNGVHVALLPLENPAREQAIITSIMEEVDYQFISVELVGSFFEAFLRYNGHFDKMSPSINESVLGHLQQRYLGKSKLPAENKLESTQFLITHHLIPSQLMAYPLFNLQPRATITFRFPDHEKRFFNYTSRHIRHFERHRKAKKPRHSIHRQLTAFIELYLHRAKTEQWRHYLFIDKDSLKKNPAKMRKPIIKFAQRGQRNNNYPRQHI